MCDEVKAVKETWSFQCIRKQSKSKIEKLIIQLKNLEKKSKLKKTEIISKSRRQWHRKQMDRP